MPDTTHTFKRLETNLVHAGRTDAIQGAVVHPIFQSANYLMADEDAYAAVRYIRLNNSPNHRMLHDRLAAIESGEAALVTGSGMAAITSTILAFVKSGEHILSHRALYGGTQNFLDDDAPHLKIEHTTIDMGDPSGWESVLRPQTRKHGLVSVIDNTFATPVNFRPLELGFDISLHSATKYLNGHSDIVAGAVIGSEEHIDRVRHKLNHLGGSLDPHACFLLERGIKTLAVRVERQNHNAAQLARFLTERPEVRKVQYPGLPDDPGHQRAKKLFSGFGGMLSFYADSTQRAARFLDSVRIPLHAPSLGGTESLVVRPGRSSHLGLPAAERERLGMTDDLVRVSVGIEAIDELIEDFEQALRA